MFNSQPKGLNGSLVYPNLAKSENLCPVIDSSKFENNWNSFIDLLKRSESVKDQTTVGTLTSRLSNLISLGNAIIQYVEVTKRDNSSISMFGYGWYPNINTTLYLDIEYVISQNIGLLYTEEQGFFTVNTQNNFLTPTPTPTVVSNLLKMKKTDEKDFKEKVSTFNNNKLNLIKAMTNGFSKMATMRKTF